MRGSLGWWTSSISRCEARGRHLDRAHITAADPTAPLILMRGMDRTLLKNSSCCEPRLDDGAISGRLKYLAAQSLAKPLLKRSDTFSKSKTRDHVLKGSRSPASQRRPSARPVHRKIELPPQPAISATDAIQPPTDASHQSRLKLRHKRLARSSQKVKTSYDPALILAARAS